MICECGSERIQWDMYLIETQCPDCGGLNCHVIDEGDAPIGSCEQCGVNLYRDDHPYYCAQCEFSNSQGGELP